VRPIPGLLILPAALIGSAPALAVDYLTVPQAQQLLFPEADRFVDATVDVSDDQSKAESASAGRSKRSGALRKLGS
jgi:hypothetical protein